MVVGGAVALVIGADAPHASADPVPPAPRLSARTQAAWAQAHVTCNSRYPAGDGVALCPPFRPRPPGDLHIRPRAWLRVKVRGALGVTCALTRPLKHEPTFARIIVRLETHRVAGSHTLYQALLPRRIPAHTNGLACTADFRKRHFAAYDLGVRVLG